MSEQHLSERDGHRVLGLFAADEVGLEIARFLGEKDQSVACLVMDSKDPKDLNRSILSALNAQEVFYSDELYEDAVLKRLKGLAPDLIILAWWPYILKEKVIEIPALGCLNFHPSYLPNNRGKHPYFWSIVEQVPFGVTLHYVDAGIDSGDIVFQEVLDTSWEDTGSSLYERSKRAMVDLFKRNFEKIRQGDLFRKRQDPLNARVRMASEIHEASRIHLDHKYRARDLLNLVRARSNFSAGASWFEEGGERYEVRVDIRRARQ